jgi:hypothetical protein
MFDFGPSSTTAPAPPALKAIIIRTFKVIVNDPELRAWLIEHDREALARAEGAIRAYERNDN